MNQETANYIMQRMSKYLDNSQMIKLKHTLDESLRQSEDGGAAKEFTGTSGYVPSDKATGREIRKNVIPLPL